MSDYKDIDEIKLASLIEQGIIEVYKDNGELCTLPSIKESAINFSKSVTWTVEEEIHESLQ